MAKNARDVIYDVLVKWEGLEWFGFQPDELRHRLSRYIFEALGEDGFLVSNMELKRKEAEVRTMRMELAKAAMQGILSTPKPEKYEWWQSEDYRADVAEQAFAMADDMMAEAAK